MWYGLSWNIYSQKTNQRGRYRETYRYGYTQNLFAKTTLQCLAQKTGVFPKHIAEGSNCSIVIQPVSLALAASGLKAECLWVQRLFAVLIGVSPSLETKTKQRPKNRPF